MSADRYHTRDGQESCLECGALIWDTGVHDFFHSLQDKMFATLQGLAGRNVTVTKPTEGKTYPPFPSDLRLDRPDNACTLCGGDGEDTLLGLDCARCEGTGTVDE